MENLVPLALDLALKSSLILGLAWLITLLMRRGSAAGRHLVWTLAVASVLALPVLAYLLPGLAILPAAPTLTWVESSPTSEPAADREVDAPAVTSAGPSYVDPPAGAITPHDAVREPGPLTSGGGAEAGAASIEGPAPLPEAPATVAPANDAETTAPSWSSVLWHWLPWVWLGGMSFALLPLLLGWLSLLHLRRTARPITVDPWQTLLHDLSQHLGLKRKVVLLKSPCRTMPMTWGAWPGAPANVLVPEDADDWSADRQRAVLLHELAHVKRWDCLTQILSQLACAIYWFNPLIWLAAHRMLIEREQACDDMVLLHETDSADYAQHLLDIATGPQAGLFAAHAGIAMARRSKLDGRLVAILDQHRNRRAMSRLGVALTITLVGAVAVPVACVQVVEQEAADEERHETDYLEYEHAGETEKRFVVIGPAGSGERGTRTGSFELTGPDYRLLDALAAARGVPSGVRFIHIYRQASDGGQPRVIRVPYDTLLDGHARYNIAIQPGDVIRIMLPDAVPERAAMIERADQLVTALETGNFEQAREHFDDRMREQLSPQELEAMWLQLDQVGGEYEGRGEPYHRRENGYDAIYVPLRWERNAVDLKVVIDDEGHIAGLWTRAPDATVALPTSANARSTPEPTDGQATRGTPQAFVLGQVSKQGAYTIAEEGIEVGELLARAGLDEYQLDQPGYIDWYRNDTVTRVPLPRIAVNDPPIRSVLAGDVVRVTLGEAAEAEAPSHEDSGVRWVYIVGDVQRPGAYVLPDDGELTLLQLVASTGNLIEEDGGMSIEVLRRQPDGKGVRLLPRTKLSELIDGETQTPELQTYDVIIVRAAEQGNATEAETADDPAEPDQEAPDAGDAATERVDLLRELVVSRQRQFERVQQQMEAGRASPDDVEQARQALIEAQLQLAAAEDDDGQLEAAAGAEPARQVVYITGPVGRPGAYVLPEDGMTLLQLIASADNVQWTGVPAVIEIVRQQPDGSERRLPRIRVKDLIEGEAENPRLQAGDVVIVRQDPEALRQRERDNLRQQRQGIEHLGEGAEPVQRLDRLIEELEAREANADTRDQFNVRRKQITQLLDALEMYRDKHEGRFPDGLADVEPYLDEPVDLDRYYYRRLPDWAVNGAPPATMTLEGIPPSRLVGPRVLAEKGTYEPFERILIGHASTSSTPARVRELSHTKSVTVDEEGIHVHAENQDAEKDGDNAGVREHMSLQFRIVPTRETLLEMAEAMGADDGEQVIDVDEAIELARQVLVEAGAEALRRHDVPFAWFPLREGLDLGGWEVITTEHEGRTYLLVANREPLVMQPVVDGERQWRLMEVLVTEDQQGRPAIGVALDDAGGEQMRALTGPNVGNNMAIVLDGEVLTAPTLQAMIAGRSQITGNFSDEEVNRIVEQLEAAITQEEVASP
ncbi:M56 family metallopeptidase [Phycisphaerales bacterium AB-hyl4]|uniref:M56 family metallopeptidase n=1 Tax=Natronomicrosphaera hydrolytica TaxID=3242702 RepID=A0ABV4UAD8_9BACT